MKRVLKHFAILAVAMTSAGATTQPSAADTPPQSPTTAPAWCCGLGPCMGMGFGGARGAGMRTAMMSGPTTQPFSAGGWGRGPAAGRGFGRGPAWGRGAGAGRGFAAAWGPGLGAARGMPAAMLQIHSLLNNHQQIHRSVSEIPGGVETTTTSDDPLTTQLIRTHTLLMKQRLEAGQPIRMWDPLYVELFRHHDQISIQLSEIPGGVRVVETSQDPNVTLLIRQHANRAVSEFVTAGWNRVHQPTTLPSGYAR
jgi:hypothetical protein